MHVDRPYQIAVEGFATLLATPNPPFRFVLMPTSGTLATCSSFGASEARDVSLFRFVCEIVNVLSIFPQCHPLIMMSTIILGAYAMGIANEKASYLVLHAKVDDLSRGFVTQITDTPFDSFAHPPLGMLQFLPATGILLTAGLLLGDLSVAHRALSLQGADTPSGHDHGLARICRNCCQVDFAEIYRGVNLSWGIFGLGNLNADMQLEAIIPDQRACATVLWQIERKRKRRASPPHRQDGPSFFLTHGLSWPFDGIEALRAPWVLHFHLRVSFAKLARGLDIGKKRMHDHLHRLTMQGKAPFGHALQRVTSRPGGVLLPCLLMGLHADIPDLSCFHLSGLQSAKLALGQVIESIYTCGFHLL